MIINGDSNKELKKLDSGTADMCITSPPYYGLRDYGVDEQLGLEETVDEYIDNLCSVFDEVARVLKPEGTCWVNIGDSYSNTGCGKGTGHFNNRDVDGASKPVMPKQDIPSKSLLGVPFRFTLEMMSRGWILRNTIIWHKPSCMPCSVSDRFTVDFEYLFFFARQQKYYFEQQLEPAHNWGKRDRTNGKYTGITHSIKGVSGKEDVEEPTRNKRAVWSINPARFKEAHFATYPEELIATPIRACCPKGGIVLDPFFGAGTSGLVSKKQGKDFIGIELNQEYADIAQKRIRQYTDQKRLF